MVAESTVVLGQPVKRPPACRTCTLMQYPEETILQCTCVDPENKREEQIDLNLTLQCPHTLKDRQLIGNIQYSNGMLTCKE